MKNIILFIVLYSLCWGARLHAQYEPMVSENKFWIYQQYASNDEPNIAGGFLMQMEGDTVLDNQSYTIVWQKNLSGTHPCPLDQRPCFAFDLPYRTIDKTVIGFIRESLSEKKVYFRPVSGTYCNQNEYLLFDFSLNIGDSLDTCKQEALGGLSSYGQIDSITVQSAFGTTRKVWHTFGFVTYIGLPFEGPVNILEGVGFERFGLFHVFNNGLELFDFCDNTIETCNLVLANKAFSFEHEISPFPNPTNGVSIWPKGLQIMACRITNLSGQSHWLSHQNNQIDLTAYENGLYFLEGIAEDGQKIYTKILKY